jgi:hypothetical protein
MMSDMLSVNSCNIQAHEIYHLRDVLFRRNSAFQNNKDSCNLVDANRQMRLGFVGVRLAMLPVIAYVTLFEGLPEPHHHWRRSVACFIVLNVATHTTP